MSLSTPADGVTRAHIHTLLAVIVSEQVIFEVASSPARTGRGEERFGYTVLTVSSAAVPNGIAAICLAMRDEFGLIPHVYFDWTEGSPLIHFLRFILWGSGEVAPVTREILRRAEPDRSRRPHVHVG